MKKIMVMFIVATLFSATQASANQIIVAVDDGSAADWESLVNIDLGDKQFAYISQTGLDENVDALFNETVPNQRYNVALTGLEIGPIENFEILFSIAIQFPFSLDLDLGSTELDSISLTNNTSVVAEIYSDAGYTNLLSTMNSVNGSNVGPVAFDGGDQIWVRLLGSVDDTGLLSSVTLSVTQVEAAPIPEPSSLALAGLGAFSMFGVMWARRRKNGTLHK